jgi:hypothetical protein
VQDTGYAGSCYDAFNAENSVPAQVGTNGVVCLVPSKTDSDQADALREKLRDALLLVCKVLDEGRDAGLEASFSIGLDYMNRYTIALLKIAKPL